MIAQLYQSITQLSAEVEALLDAKDEENCPELLRQRQSLLEQLAEEVAAISDTESKRQESHNYVDFLRSIQARDSHYAAYAEQQKKAIFSERSQQVKTNKAIKAYHNIL